jgi:hypothetical protein
LDNPIFQKIDRAIHQNVEDGELPEEKLFKDVRIYITNHGYSEPKDEKKTELPAQEWLTIGLFKACVVGDLCKLNSLKVIDKFSQRVLFLYKILIMLGHTLVKKDAANDVSKFYARVIDTCGQRLEPAGDDKEFEDLVARCSILIYYLKEERKAYNKPKSGCPWF